MAPPWLGPSQALYQRVSGSEGVSKIPVPWARLGRCQFISPDPGVTASCCRPTAPASFIFPIRREGCGLLRGAWGPSFWKQMWASHSGQQEDVVLCRQLLQQPRTGCGAACRPCQASRGSSSGSSASQQGDLGKAPDLSTHFLPPTGARGAL